MKNITGVSDLESLQNTTLLSDWWTITQEMIDRFADAAFDHQWIHVDPKRASTESPFGQHRARISHFEPPLADVETMHR